MQTTLLHERPRPEPPPPAIVTKVMPMLIELFGGAHRIPVDDYGRPHLMVDNYGDSAASNVAVPLVHKSMASADFDFGTRVYLLAHKYRFRVDVEYIDEEQEEEHTFCGGEAARNRGHYQGLVLRVWDRSTPDAHGWRHPGLGELIEMAKKMQGEGEAP